MTTERGAERKRRRSSPRQSRRFTKLIRLLEERASSGATEPIRREALKNLQSLLVHIDEQKNKSEERRIRRELAKLRAGMGLDPEPSAVNNTNATASQQAQEPTLDEQAANNPELAKALAEYRAIVGKEK
jgi:hypothetical protein